MSGFHSRFDMVANLNIDDIFKGFMLLRQAWLSIQDNNIIVGSASGNFDVVHLTAALRNSFRLNPPAESTMATHQPDKNQNPRDVKTDRNRHQNLRPPSKGGSRHTFYTFKNDGAPRIPVGTVLDSGAFSSLVGKYTL